MKLKPTHLGALCGVVTACAAPLFGQAAEQPTLRQAAPDDLLVGTAIMSHALDQPQHAELIGEQFNAITPENEMKPIELHPEKGRFTFERADKIVDFAREHDMEVIGHTLVWHAQSPRFLYEDEQGNPLPREEALANMKEHITTVVQHFKGRVKGWDVVNEAVPDGEGDLRDTPALRAIGDDYILKAFEFAHEADPDVELYYNDYNIDQDYKRDRALKLVKRIRDAGLRIDGVGIQGHYLLGSPSLEEIERGIKAYTDEGFDVMITELDVDPLPRRGRGGADLTAGERGGDSMNPYTDGLPDDVQQQLAQRYEDLFELFLKYDVSRVTLWGTTDGSSWLNGFPMRGRTNHPLLFDREFQPKPAFDSVINVLQQSGGGDEPGASATEQSASDGVPLEPPFKWTASGILVPAPEDPERPVVSIKDPSVVYHDGKYHIIATVARPGRGPGTGWQMVYLSFENWEKAAEAKPYFMDQVNPGLRGYHCAPQVFWYEPQQKWYLIFQSQHPQYSTTDDISDPTSWSQPQDFFEGKPETAPDLWIDYFVIADDTHTYLWFTGDNGKLYRSRTTLEEFPNGMSEPVVVLEDENRFNLFEGSAHYKLQGSDKYLTLVEAIGPDGRRWYRAWTADKLDGEWTPLAETWNNPFASTENIEYAEGAEPWTQDISHGEILRVNPDQTMTIDPNNLQLLFQGREPSNEPIDYLELPYRLGILTLQNSGAKGGEASTDNSDDL